MGAKFKVGDRVKTNYAETPYFGKGDIGTVHRVSSHYYVQFDSPNFGGGQWYVRPDGLEPALRIEAGKFYKTRDGRKVGPMEPARYGGFYDRKRQYTSYAWCENGSYINGLTCQLDLIAEWPAEPANPAAQVDNLRDEYGGGVVAAAAVKPKFKVGDRVRCLRNNGAPHYFTVGKTYTVGKIEPAGRGSFGDLVSCFPDVPNRFGLTGPVGQFSDAWELVPTSPAIVALIEDGQPKPATRPFVHDSVEAATAEAERLAAKHKGQEFGVYELVHTAKEAKVYEHEWQRLAADGHYFSAANMLTKSSGISYDAAFKEAKAVAA